MEQFNPCLRNFVAMGKSYEKALSSEYIILFFFSFISSPSHPPSSPPVQRTGKDPYRLALFYLN